MSRGAQPRPGIESPPREAGRGTPPRVCVLTETYYPVVGGGERQAQALAEGLAARGWQSLVMTRRSAADLPATERIGPLQVHRLRPTGPRHLNKWGLLLTGLPALIRLRDQYDILVVSGFRILGVPAVVAGWLLGKRCILKADSLGEMSGAYFTAGLRRLGLKSTSLPMRAFLSLRNVLLRRADLFVAISTEIARELWAAGIGPQAIELVPNSVDVRRFRPVAPEAQRALRLRLGLPTEARIVTFTGRLVTYKGVPRLLRCWRVLREGNPDALLLLVGGGGLGMDNCEEELRRYVREHDLGDVVRFTGDVRNVHEYLQASDIFAFPTEDEAFGISLIEAMSCGLPAVATRVGGIPDVLQDGINGLLIDPADEQALEMALVSLLGDRDLRQRLGSAARRRVVEQYSESRVVERYMQLIEEVLATRDRKERETGRA